MLTSELKAVEEVYIICHNHGGGLHLLKPQTLILYNIYKCFASQKGLQIHTTQTG